mgnify:CR=1 FL=1
MYVAFADAEGQGDRGMRYDSTLVTTVMTTSKRASVRAAESRSRRLSVPSGAVHAAGPPRLRT